MTSNSHKIESGSLLEGINIAAPVKKQHRLSPRERLNNFADNWEWTPKRKRNAAVALCLFSICALGAGTGLMMYMRPPGLPKTAEEALAVMKSDKFDRLDEAQKEEYEDAANKLIGELPWDQRRALFKDDRESMEKLMERNMDEMARKMARGETPDWPMGPGGRDGGGRWPQGRPEGERPRRPEGENGNGNGGGGPGGGGPGGGGGGPGGPGRGGDPNARRDAAVARIGQRVATGNPQSNGLMGQMRQAMQQARGPR